MKTAIRMSELIWRLLHADWQMAANRIVAEDLPYIHTDEGPDDMPGKNTTN